VLTLKSFLDWVEISIRRQTFDSGHFAALGSDGKDSARLDGFSIQ
jgi:hypothetical protein